ncbi:HSF-type DNA-binding-domain-containing protein [Halteromyces radiatus]|uniref:HSF-type DNA-binding-domain-containing protein n=1 Tax=Halteromyces radiatus TaxID=101107 RepID=UPI00221E4B0D|nr:HSF-type DNA-binding-domain-containing protein [Halteromyces radiatus]KAI8093045.1 HSF-type DNA-binding-domain-containing protein [Halteromyces radiatus]
MNCYRHEDAVTNFSVLNPMLHSHTSSTPTTATPTTVNDSSHSSHDNSNNNNSSSSNNNNKPAYTNTFVHKLFNMVIDEQYQHLISWSYTSTSFIVCNIMEFSKDVLPKHFKHSNFSSFVRQLNMYGFHKVNKSPRGHRTLAENQIWEFSHSKFIRNRPDLLEEIKRKAMETDTRNQGDFQAHLTMLQMSQSDMIQQINRLFDNFHQVVNELSDAKRKQDSQSLVIKQILRYISQQNGGNYLLYLFNLGHLPLELDGLSLDIKDSISSKITPSIYITSHESLTTSTNNNDNNNNISNIPSQQSFHQHQHQNLPSSPLTVRTQNLSSHSSPSHHHRPQQQYHQYNHTHSPVGGLNPLSATFATSISSTPTTLIASDDDTSLYSPHTPRDSSNHSGTGHTQQEIMLLHDSK